MVTSGETVLVAVSGGPDSLCVLYSLLHLRRLFRIRAEVFHFDHRLRVDSRRDADYVRRVCGRLDVPCHVRVADGRPARGDSVEAWATWARSSAAGAVSRAVGADAIAEGHTLDDQAETVLLNLIRGTGIEGVAGIDPNWGPAVGARTIQPLLAVSRQEVELFCRALHLRPRQDPMNEDRRFLRAAIRHEVLPALERATGRGVRGSIARTADTLRGDRDELYAATVGAYEEAVAEEGGDALRFDAIALRSLPPSLAARVVRMALYRSMAAEWAGPWPKAGLDAIVGLARGRPGRRCDLPDGWVAARDRAFVVVERRR
jgi:tRNA(Ile)-lysidine synthase